MSGRAKSSRILTFTSFIKHVLSSGTSGYILIIGAAINWTLGLISPIFILFAAHQNYFEWANVILFLGMPLVGLVWFLQDTSHSGTKYRRVIDGFFQLFPVLLPWVFLVEHNAR